MSQGKCTGEPLKNQRTLRISPPVRSGSIAAIGRDRRREAHRLCVNQEVAVSDSQKMEMSSAIPSTEMDETKRMKGLRYKQSECDGYFRHTVRRPIGQRKCLRDDEVSLVDWIWMNRLQQYEWQITDFARNMTELLQLDPGEVEELADECDMGIAFRRRLVHGHQVLREDNRDLIRQLSEGGMDPEAAKQRANENWSRRQSWNQKPRHTRLKPEGREGPSLLSQVKLSERAQFNEAYTSVYYNYKNQNHEGERKRRKPTDIMLLHARLWRWIMRILLITTER